MLKTLLRLGAGFAVAAFSLFSATTVFAASATPLHSMPTTCSGGAIAPGTYSSLTVTGVCSIPSGRVFVNGPVNIKANAALLAASPTAQVIITGDVHVGHNATFIMGCSPAFGCDTVTSDRITGRIQADRALGVILHSDSLHGDITITSGGGGSNCNPNPLYQGPVFTDLEDNAISGHVTISGVHSCWLGLFRNKVAGTVTLTNNLMADPDANEVATNYIYDNLDCSGNFPAPQIGDSGGTINHVSGHKLGQCVTV